MKQGLIFLFFMQLQGKINVYFLNHSRLSVDSATSSYETIIQKNVSHHAQLKWSLFQLELFCSGFGVRESKRRIKSGEEANFESDIILGLFYLT